MQVAADPRCLRIRVTEPAASFHPTWTSSGRPSKDVMQITFRSGPCRYSAKSPLGAQVASQ